MTSALRALGTRPLPSRWRRALPVFLMVFFALLVIYYDTAKAMVSIWARSDTFAHAFLVLPIVLWLVWRQRHALAVLEPKPCAWMLLPMAALAFAWLLGDLASVNSVTQLAMTGLLVLAVPTVLGLEVASIIAFPLAFMFFAVPVGDFLLPQLMSWTADFTVLALQATGIPVYREGNQFTIPSGNWSVVEACSGVRYLIASFMVGTLFAYLNYRSSRRRWIFVAISLAVPIVANWVRAYLIVLLGHFSGNKLAVGADHLIYGWLFFGLVVGLMYAIGMAWAETNASSSIAPTKTDAPLRSPPRQFERFWMAGAAAVVLAITPRLLLSAPAGVGETTAPSLSELATLAGGWQVSKVSVADWRPSFANPSAQISSTYRSSNDQLVGVYIGYYRGQGYRRKLVSSSNELVKSDDPKWSLVSSGLNHTLKLPAQTVQVRSAFLRRLSSLGGLDQRLLAWQVYWVADRLIESDQLAKIYGAWDRLMGRRDDGAVIILYALDEPSGAASQSLELFAQTNLSAIVTQLRKTREESRASVAASSYGDSSEMKK
jgi:exosortase A